MKKLLLLAALACAFIFNSEGSNVDWGAQLSNSLGLADGSLAPQGSLVRLGYFTVSDAQIQTYASAGDKLSLNSAFQQFDSSTVGFGYPGTDGVWGASSSNGNASFVGKNIYYWTVNAGTLNAASQWGIFKNPNLFPSDSPLPGSFASDINQVPQDLTGLIVGSFGGGPDANFGNPLYKMASVTPVPEPSTMAFGLIVGLTVLCRRQRPARTV